MGARRRNGGIDRRRFRAGNLSPRRHRLFAQARRCACFDIARRARVDRIPTAFAVARCRTLPLAFPPIDQPRQFKPPEEYRMSIPFNQIARIGAYILKQELSGKKRYPLVLMLEPLFRCNLACAGCGKIDYPDEILNQRAFVRSVHGRDRRMRRAGGVDRRRRTAASPGNAADRRRSPRAQEVRHLVHQCAVAGKEDRSVQAQPLSSRGRSIWMAIARCTIDRFVRRASTTRPSRRFRLAKAQRLPGHDQLHAVQQRTRPTKSPRSSIP